MNTKQIKTKLNAFLRADKNQRDKLQELIVLTRNHAMEHRDFTLLSDLIKGLRANKTRNLKAITAYIQEFTKGIKWVNGDKYEGYKKQGELEFIEFPMPWYDHNANAQVIADLDPVTQLKAMMTRWSNALNGKAKQHVKAGMEEMTAEAINKIQSITAELEQAQQAMEQAEPAKA